MSENKPSGSPPVFKSQDGKVVLWSKEGSGAHVSGYISDQNGQQTKIFGFFGISPKTGSPYLKLLKHTANSSKGETIGFANPDIYPNGSHYELKLNGQETGIQLFPQRGMSEQVKSAIGCNETLSHEQNQKPDSGRIATP